VDLNRQFQERMRIVDLVLVESPEALNKCFSAKRKVMTMVVCSSRAEERREKGIFGCLQVRKVLRDDLATVSSHDHLGRWFEGSTCTG
jgi:hypothetical protein